MSATSHRSVGLILLVLWTGLSGIGNFFFGSQVVLFGGAVGDDAGIAIMVLGALGVVLGFALLFAAAGLWLGRMGGWLAAVVIYGLSAVSLALLVLAGAGTASWFNVLANVVPVGYLLLIRERFTGGGEDREEAVPDSLHT